jgi:hypothetical protein
MSPRTLLQIGLIIDLLSLIWLAVFPKMVPHPGPIGADLWIASFLVSFIIGGVFIGLAAVRKRVS